MSFRTREFEKKFEGISHYKKHPQMMPFIGKDWGKFKKLLIVGESHYLATDSERAKKWYDITSTDLTAEEKRYTATAEILEEFITNCSNKKSPPKGHTMYRNIQNAMCEVSPNVSPLMLSYCAFMNYFQRPAEETGESINRSTEDENIAYSVLCQVVEIIRPNYVFFCTSEGWKAFELLQREKKALPEGTIVGHACHATSRHWNMASKRYSCYKSSGECTGKEAFTSFVSHYKIFSERVAKN